MAEAQRERAVKAEAELTEAKKKIERAKTLHSRFDGDPPECQYDNYAWPCEMRSILDNPPPGDTPEAEPERTMSDLRAEINKALNSSEDWCARCQHCDRQVDAVWAVVEPKLSEAMAEAEQLRALTAECSCGGSYEVYGGPEPDCAVHGAIRALNEMQAELAQARVDCQAMADEAERLRRERDHAAEAAKSSHEGIRLWMLDCAALTSKQRDRAGRAEAAIRRAQELHCPAPIPAAGARFCTECTSHAADGVFVRWPCATLAELNPAGGSEEKEDPSDCCESHDRGCALEPAAMCCEICPDWPAGSFPYDDRDPGPDPYGEPEITTVNLRGAQL